MLGTSTWILSPTPCVFNFDPFGGLRDHHTECGTDLKIGSFNVWVYFREGVSTLALVELKADAPSVKPQIGTPARACGL